MKICTSCDQEKDYSQFSKRAAMRDGYRSACKACELKRNQEYYSKPDNWQKHIDWTRSNPNRAATQKKSYDKHRDKRVQDAANYRSLNPEKISLSQIKHRASHKHIRAERQRRRNERIACRMPKWADKEAIISIYKLSAQMGCGYQVDHIIPLLGKTVSGLHVENNLRIITTKANRQKSNKLIAELL